MLKAIKNFYRSHKKPARIGIVSVAVVGLVALLWGAAYNAPPSIQLSNEAITSDYKTDDDAMVIAGQVSTLHASTVEVNGKPVAVDANGKFEYRLSLAEGETAVRIVSTSVKGANVKQFKVHRTTATEFAERKRIAEEKAAKAKQDAFNALPACDGTAITARCKVEGVAYRTYIYHPAVAERTHVVTDTTYREEVVSYCTLCNDGTYSPSCATGRGACSWHGGVAQWNAPRTRKVPVYTDRVVVDAPAVPERYEKVLDPALN